MKITEKYVYFWGEWLSNFTNAPFTTKVNGKEHKFYNSEQYFMFLKAITFDDEKIANRILTEGIDPKRAKNLGRKVSNFDNEKWDRVKYKIMKKANMLKYTQNQHLLNKLLDKQFDNKHFVEASPYDEIWGIKCSVEDAKDDKSNWNGQNLLGQVLDEVRETLINENKQF